MNQEQVNKLTEIIGEEYGNTVGIVVQKSGEIVYEKYFGAHNAKMAAHIFSVTKSVVSALVGIAIQQGYIKNVNQKVLRFFPQYTVQVGETGIQEVTLAHLLSMTAPYKCQAEPYADFFASSNWVEFALGILGGEKPSGAFRYSPIVGAHILGGVLATATGQSVGQFAAENLFAPLGIVPPQNVELLSEEDYFAFPKDTMHNYWVVDPQGIHTASWGLTLTTQDMAKIGQLYLNKGMWKGKQILPATWVTESTTAHSLWEEMGLPYGYLWWLVHAEDGAYAAMGDGGNIIYVNPKKELVVASTALFVPDAKNRIELVQAHIEPLFI